MHVCAMYRHRTRRRSIHCESHAHRVQMIATCFAVWPIFPTHTYTHTVLHLNPYVMLRIHSIHKPHACFYNTYLWATNFWPFKSPQFYPNSRVYVCVSVGERYLHSPTKPHALSNSSAAAFNSPIERSSAGRTPN